MANALQLAGSRSHMNRGKYGPIFVNRFFQGLWTQRNPLRDAGSTRVEEHYFGARGDALIDGQNVEISSRLSLIRRPGTTIYNTNTFPQINSFYEFRKFTSSSESISVMADTPNAVFDVTGPSNNTLVFLKGQGAGNTSFQSVGNILCFCNGVDQMKYLSNGTSYVAQNLGISNTTSSKVQVTPTTATSTNSTNVPQANYDPWINPTNIGDPTQFTFTTLPADGVSTAGLLTLTNLGLQFPTQSVITGIQVSFDYASSTQNPAPLDVEIYNGPNLLAAKFAVNRSFNSTQITTAKNYTIGGPTDLWGLLTSNPILATGNRTNLSFAFFLHSDPNNSSEQSATQYLRNCQITFYTSTIPQVTINGAGNFTATAGYQYVYAYGNSLNGGVSSPTPASLTTGAFANAANIQIPLIASSDPQVNQIHLFRTLDGGSVFFELAASPFTNINQTISDSSLDTSLQLQTIIEVGTGNNNPPPPGLTSLTYHLGRLWGRVANTVYYSRTADGTVGDPIECFPPTNFFIFPSTVVRMVPTILGLVIFTTSDIYIILGNGTDSSPLISSPYLSRVGIQNYNALAVNGSTIYLMTSDSQVLAIDPNSGVSEIGFPLGDKFEQLDPAQVYLTWHVDGSRDKAVYVGDGSSGWYRMSPTSAPESGLIWSPFAEIQGQGVQAVQSVEVTPGVYKLLIGPGLSGGKILFRDWTTFADNGTSYLAFATIGSLVLALPSQMAELAYITTDSSAIGSIPQVRVLIGEISGTFQPLLNFVNDPPALAPSTTIYSARFHFSQNSNVSAWCRHMQIKFTWPAENKANELLAYTLVGAHWSEL